MIFENTTLDGSYVIKPEKIEDNRGFFSRLFCEDIFKQKNLNTSWQQINNSFNKSKGTLRGLHLQNKPFDEIKLVRCITGAIWDVIVDVRTDSKTFGQYFGKELSSENRNMMYVPTGFAHGFISLTENSELIYLVSAPYSKDYEITIKWDDPFINIVWPTKPKEISEKDQNGMSLNNLYELKD